MYGESLKYKILLNLYCLEQLIIGVKHFKEIPRLGVGAVEPRFLR